MRCSCACRRQRVLSFVFGLFFFHSVVVSGSIEARSVCATDMPRALLAKLMTRKFNGQMRFRDFPSECGDGQLFDTFN